MKRLILLTIITFFVLWAFPALAAPEGAGVKDAFLADWASDTIREVWNFELMVGYPPDYKFRPNDEITRAEFATVIARAMGYYLANGKPVWYQPFVDTLYEKGVLLSKDGPWDVPIKRGEMAAWIGRALTVLNVPPVREVKTFPDLSESYPEYADIAKASRYAIVKGYPDGTFGPDRTATRAETATMILRMVVQPKDQAPTLEQMLDVILQADKVDVEAHKAARTGNGKVPAPIKQAMRDYGTDMFINMPYGWVETVESDVYFIKGIRYGEIASFQNPQAEVLSNTVAKIKTRVVGRAYFEDGTVKEIPPKGDDYIYLVKGADGKWRISEA